VVEREKSTEIKSGGRVRYNLEFELNQALMAATAADLRRRKSGSPAALFLGFQKEKKGGEVGYL
jgi:hypothetical protein